jgi:hypothetical protein
VVGQVEVELVRAVQIRIDVQVTARPVRLRAAGLVQEWDEDGAIVLPAIERVRRQLVRRAADLEAQHPGSMGRPELAVAGRDLEVGRLVTGIRLQRSRLEDQRLIDREVRQAGERRPLGGRDRTARVVGVEVVLVLAEALDRLDVRHRHVLMVIVPVLVVVVVVVVVRVVIVVVFVGHGARSSRGRPSCACHTPAWP